MLAQALNYHDLPTSNLARKTSAEIGGKLTKGAAVTPVDLKARIAAAAQEATFAKAKKDAALLEKRFERDIRRSEIQTMKKLLRIDLSLTDGQLATFVQPALNKILEKYNKPVTPAILAAEGKRMADAINLLMVEKTRLKRGDNNLDIGLTINEKISAMAQKICQEQVETKSDLR